MNKRQNFIKYSFLLTFLLIGLLLQTVVISQDESDCTISLDLEQKELTVQTQQSIRTDIYVNSSAAESLDISLSGKWIGDQHPSDIDVKISETQGVTPYTSSITFLSTSLETGHFTYELTASDGSKSCSTSIELVVTYTHTMSIKTDKNHYKQGEQIHISGSIDTNPLPDTLLSSMVFLNISHDDFIRICSVELTNNTFEFSYNISYGDPIGEWMITTEIFDDAGNSGKKSTSIQVSLPEDTVRYRVVWYSPPENVVYKRGSIFNISVYVTENELGVSNASTQCILPSMETIDLTETKQGYYQQSYVIPWDGSLGKWMITVESKKGSGNTSEVGGGNTVLTIQPATLQMTLIEPVNNEFQINGSIPFKILLRYPDDSVVQNAMVLLNTSIGSTTLEYLENGTYAGTLSLNGYMQGNYIIEIHGSDPYDNTVTMNKVFYVTVRDQNDVSLVMIMAVLSVIIGCFLIVYLFRGQFDQIRFRDIDTEIEEINRLQTETVIAYYQKGSISRPTYDLLRKQHEQRLAELHNKKKRKEK
jgi:hypothetical protein